MRIRVFGPLRERLGCTEIDLTDQIGATAGSVLDRLVELHPEFAPFRHTVRLAVDHEVVAETAVIGTGAEVAVIPPVSGG